MLCLGRIDITRLLNSRYEEIKEIITDTFCKLGIKCLPINAFEFAHGMGYKVIPYSSKRGQQYNALLSLSEDGFVTKIAGIWYIYYNDAKQFTRISYTIMHECGHIILDHTEHSDIAEKEANFFASYALAPHAVLAKLSVNDPMDIVDKCNIGLEAAIYSFESYRKRQLYCSNEYKPYEKTIINLFSDYIIEQNMQTLGF